MLASLSLSLSLSLRTGALNIPIGEVRVIGRSVGRPASRSMPRQ